MSDNTTPETPNPAPENVVPFTPAPEAQPPAAEIPPFVSDASSTPAAEQTAQEPAQPQPAPTIHDAVNHVVSQVDINTVSHHDVIHDAVNHVVSQVDINTVSHHDVIHDLFQSSQEYAFKLLLAAKVFEQMIIRDSVGLKGQVYDLLRHADEAVVNEVHAILAAKVEVPKTEAPAAE